MPQTNTQPRCIMFDYAKLKVFCRENGLRCQYGGIGQPFVSQGPVMQYENTEEYVTPGLKVIGMLGVFINNSYLKEGGEDVFLSTYIVEDHRSKKWAVVRYPFFDYDYWETTPDMYDHRCLRAETRSVSLEDCGLEDIDDFNTLYHKLMELRTFLAKVKKEERQLIIKRAGKEYDCAEN